MNKNFAAPATTWLVTALLSLAAHAESPRETSTVRLIRQVHEGVVAVFSEGKGAANGTGSVLHESGFILTSNHVVEDRLGKVLFADGTVRPYSLFGRLPEKDLAVITITPQQPCTRIPLGRSDDLMAGEPVLVVGNPGSRGVVYSSGIVSAPNILFSGPDALVMSAFKHDTRDRFIQFDATSNPGNSGGPLINAEGRQIGVVSKKQFKEENINYAIPVDRVRRFLPDLLAPEERFHFWLGLQVPMLQDKATVAQVEPHSPASNAGLQPGDTILSANHHPVRDPIDWIILLSLGHGQASWDLDIQRQGHELQVHLPSAPYPEANPEPLPGKQPGLHYAYFPLDEIRQLPDFTKLTPSKTGIVTSLTPAPIAGSRLENYAVVYDGYLNIEKEGFQRLVTSADDGCRLILDGRTIVEDPGPHPAQETSGPICVKPGLHRLHIEYYNGAGAGELKLYIRPSGAPQQEVTDSAFWHE